MRGPEWIAAHDELRKIVVELLDLEARIDAGETDGLSEHDVDRLAQRVRDITARCEVANGSDAK